MKIALIVTTISLELLLLAFLVLNPKLSLLINSLPPLEAWLLVPYGIIVLISTTVILYKLITFFKTDRLTLILLSFIIICALILRLEPPLRHYVFEDEPGSLHNALMIVKTGKARNCVFGIYQGNNFNCINQSQRGSIETKTGYPTLLAIFISTFKNTETVAFTLNLILSILTIFIIFSIGTYLSSKKAGLIAAALAAAFPFHILWSTTSSIEIPALFFMSIGILSFLKFTTTKSFNYLVLSLLFSIYASFIRPEAIFAVIPILTFTVITNNTRLTLNKSWIKTLVLTSILTLALVSVSVSLLDISRYSKQANWQPLFSIQYFYTNLSAIAKYHLGTKDVTLLVLLSGCILGSFQLIKRSPKIFACLISIPIFFFIFFNAYFSGGYLNTTSRFALLWMFTIIPFAGVGIENISKPFLKNNDNKKVIIIVFSILIIFTFYLQLNYEKLIPFKSDSQILQMRNAKFIFQKSNPSCLYTDTTTLVPTHVTNGFSSIGFARLKTGLKDKDLLLLNFDCIVMFEPVKEDERLSKSDFNILLQNYSFEKVNYPPVQTWVLTSNRQYRETLITPIYEPLKLEEWSTIKQIVSFLKD